MHGSTLAKPLWATPHLRITFLILCLFAPSLPLFPSCDFSESHNCALPQISFSAETDESIESQIIRGRRMHCSPECGSRGFLRSP